MNCEQVAANNAEAAYWESSRESCSWHIDDSVLSKQIFSLQGRTDLELAGFDFVHGHSENQQFSESEADAQGKV